MAGHLGRGTQPDRPGRFFESPIMSRFDRHLAYFRLLDVAFVLQLMMVASEVIEWFGIDVERWGAFFYVLLALGVIGLLIPAALIFLRSWRDEFTEELWQKAAGTTLKALIILPIPVAIAFGILADRPAPEEDTAVLGAIRILAYLWTMAPMAFTFAFQWHRWRASA